MRNKLISGGGALAIFLACLSAPAQTNTNHIDPRSEQVRLACIKGRRYICGKILQILPDGLIVDSGYVGLLKPPLNQSWLVRATVSIQRDPTAVEQNEPNAVCIGTVVLTALPKRPAARVYDYVVLLGYPAGKQSYVPVAGVRKTARRFSASLEHAVKLNLEAEPR